MKFSSTFKLPKVNRVIPIIIVSDFLLTMSASLLAPVFALFVTQTISGGRVEVVGFAIAIYWIVKSVLQLPIASYLDRNHGEVDDYYFMIAGLMFGSLIMLSYYFVTKTWHIYLLQALQGVGDAFLLPPFYAIFTRHIDPGNEGFEWSLRSSFSFGGGAALGGALGGLLLAAIGFRKIFLVSSVFYVASAAVLLLMKPYIIPRTPKTVGRIPLEQKKI